jgi:Thioredoxin reductase
MAYQAIFQPKPLIQATLPHYDVVIIGAGPYGLSHTAHISG